LDSLDGHSYDVSGALIPHVHETEFFGNFDHKGTRSVSNLPKPDFSGAVSIDHTRLVEAAKFLPATKSTNHFMFDPRSLSSGKPFVRLHRTESLIVLYLRNVEYGVFKVLSQFCID